jgi:phytoene desaturase
MILHLVTILQGNVKQYMSQVNIIGSGFSSLAAACYLAQAGHHVTVFEKNAHLGGRAQVFKKDGFQFDMGPTWYWMPDIFERFFADFGKKPQDYYELIRLDPAYRVYFDKQDYVDISGKLEEIIATFEEIESGSGVQLKKFLANASDNYDVAIKDLVYKPGLNPLELVNLKTAGKLNLFFTTISGQVKKRFKNPKLQQILEFPVLFLGAKPTQTPAFYNFMNFADFGLGTWHPKGGMSEVAKAMVTLGQSLGVTYKTHQGVEQIKVENGKAVGLVANDLFYPADIVVSGADYHHSERLLEPSLRSYSEAYWSKKTFAPSSLLFYVGFDKPLQNVLHHTLFFDTDFTEHSKEIYDTAQWPKDPLFYASFSSKTDAVMAPKGMEAGTFLIPIAPGLNDDEVTRARYFEIILNRLEKLTGQDVKKHILFHKSYAVNDFIKDYNSYKGNAYGLANTLLQTAFLRPKIKSNKVKNLYFTGQLTVPGPGVPPALISGKIVSEIILHTN